MIEVKEGSEFTILIADLIETLSACDEFILKIWLSSELPVKVHDEFDFLFLQEGLRISYANRTMWIWYDEIKMIEVLK